MNILERNQYLHLIGIDQWALRNKISLPARKRLEPSDQPGLRDKMEWKVLILNIKNCQRCALHQTRTQAIFGVCSCNAKLPIIGEASGMYEDGQGKSFIGRAGQLLNAMSAAVGPERAEVYC